MHVKLSHNKKFFKSQCRKDFTRFGDLGLGKGRGGTLGSFHLWKRPVSTKPISGSPPPPLPPRVSQTDPSLRRPFPGAGPSPSCVISSSPSAGPSPSTDCLLPSLKQQPPWVSWGQTSRRGRPHLQSPLLQVCHWLFNSPRRTPVPTEPLKRALSRTVGLPVWMFSPYLQLA